MKNIKIIILSLVFISSFLSCEKDDPIDRTPQRRDYQTQFNEDIIKIQNYLKTHSITVVNNPGFPDHQNVSYAIVPELDANSIWGTDPLVPNANLLSKLVTVEGVLHKIYYIKFQDGVGASPVAGNYITTYYNAALINDETTIFETSLDIGKKFNLNGLILGWQYILPEFKMGTVTGVDEYNDFGAGVMFLPSALVYYEREINNIPAYSSMIFNFKLFKVE